MSSESPVKLTAAQELQIQKAIDPHAIAEMIRAFAVENGVARRDDDPRSDQNLLYEVAESDRPAQMLSRTLKVNGQEYLVEGRTEQELLASESAVLRGIVNPPEQQRDETTGRFVSSVPERSALEAAQVADLRIQMLTGMISGEEFLIRSGEMERYQTIHSERKVFDGWASATEEFKQTLGADWCGGDAATRRMSALLIEKGYEEHPSVENLAECWNQMKQESAEECAEARIRDSQSSDQVLEALGRPKYASGMFGR